MLAWLRRSILVIASLTLSLAPPGAALATEGDREVSSGKVCIAHQVGPTTETRGAQAERTAARFVVIRVNQHALEAHLRHGDVLLPPNPC